MNELTSRIYLGLWISTPVALSIDFPLMEINSLHLPEPIKNQFPNLQFFFQVQKLDANTLGVFFQLFDTFLLLFFLSLVLCYVR